MTSETPRTEAAETRANASTNPYSVLREHARDLERKLAEAMDRSQEDWVALTQRAERAETKLAALQAKPDVAGLVDAYDAARYHFEEWNGEVLIPAHNAELCKRVAAKDAARQRLTDALLSLSAQLATTIKNEQNCWERRQEDAQRVIAAEAQLAEKESKIAQANMLIEALDELRKEKEAECNAKTEVLLEAQRIAAQAECEGLKREVQNLVEDAAGEDL